MDRNMIRQCGCSTNGRIRKTWPTDVQEGVCSACVGEWPRFAVRRYDHGRREAFAPYTLAEELQHSLYTWVRTQFPHLVPGRDDEVLNERIRRWHEEAVRLAARAAAVVGTATMSLRVEQEVGAAAEATRDRFRIATKDGRQIVRVGQYAYVVPAGVTLAPGDRVVLPANWLVSRPQLAEVTGVGTDYEGALSEIADWSKA